MRVGILGCGAIRNEIEMVTSNDPEVVYREYLDFDLHLYPADLRKAILKKLESLPVEVDVLFLGYGHCRALKGLPEEVGVPLVMLDCEDCISAMISPDRYELEKKTGDVTWFYPAGWALNGMPGLIRLFHLDSETDQGYPPEYFLNIMFDDFSRCLFIDTGIDCVEQCRKNSEEFAKILHLKHESTDGSLDQIRDAWLRTKTMGLEIQRARASGDRPEP